MNDSSFSLRFYLPSFKFEKKRERNSIKYCFRDALITCVVNTLTCLLAGCVTFSILGHIALEQGTEVAKVVKSGPGLVFLTYPEVVLKLPGASMWAIIFFVMLLVRKLQLHSLLLFNSFFTSWSLDIYISICIVLIMNDYPYAFLLL